MFFLPVFRISVIRNSNKQDGTAEILQTNRILLSEDLVDCAFRSFVPFKLNHKSRPVGICSGQINNVSITLTSR